MGQVFRRVLLSVPDLHPIGEQLQGVRARRVLVLYHTIHGGEYGTGGAVVEMKRPFRGIVDDVRGRVLALFLFHVAASDVIGAVLLEYMHQARTFPQRYAVSPTGEAACYIVNRSLLNGFGIRFGIHARMTHPATK